MGGMWQQTISKHLKSQTAPPVCLLRRSYSTHCFTNKGPTVKAARDSFALKAFLFFLKTFSGMRSISWSWGMYDPVHPSSRQSHIYNVQPAFFLLPKGEVWELLNMNKDTQLENQSAQLHCIAAKPISQAPSIREGFCQGSNKTVLASSHHSLSVVTKGTLKKVWLKLAPYFYVLEWEP